MLPAFGLLSPMPPPCLGDSNRTATPKKSPGTKDFTTDEAILGGTIATLDHHLIAVQSESSTPSIGHRTPPKSQLRINPFQFVSKQYMDILRRHNMSHCDSNQVLYRVTEMPHETLQSFSTSVVNMVERFLDQYEAPPKDADSGDKDNAKYSAHNHLQLEHVTDALSGGERSIRDESLSTVSSPGNGGRTWLALHTSAIIEPTAPQSFASVMTTASMRSMDNRKQIMETQTLRKSEDEEGNKTINKYSVVADLGRGAFGKVKLGVDNETGETVAIKIIKKSTIKKGPDPTAINREIAILKKVRHQNIVALYEVIDDPASDKLYLVMQYVCNGPIVRVKNNLTCASLPEETCKQYLKQLLSGVRYLHKRHIVHHDIKPDNILIGHDGMVYIADFGVSEMFTADQSLGESTRRGVGTPIFSAPELLVARMKSDLGPPSIMQTGESDDKDAQAGAPRSRLSSDTFDGVASDTWALGVTAYLMLVGRAPFTNDNYNEFVRSVQMDPLVWTGRNTQGDTLSPLWGEVLNGMLAKNPKERWTLKRVKQHPIFLDLADDPDVLGSMSQTKSKFPIITDAEVSHATTKVIGFLLDEQKTPFSRGASTLAQNYVSKLRRSMILPKNASIDDVAPSEVHSEEMLDSGSMFKTISVSPPNSDHSPHKMPPSLSVMHPTPPRDKTHASDSPSNPRSRQFHVNQSHDEMHGHVAAEPVVMSSCMGMKNPNDVST